MKKILYNDPFNPDCIERLKFLYLYSDEIEVLDYSSLLTDFQKDNWASFFDHDAAVDRAIKEHGSRDRNAISKLKFKARLHSKLLQKSVAPILNRIYSEHIDYWAYLRKLANDNYVTIKPLDDEFRVQRPSSISTSEAKMRADNIASELTAWTQDYIVRTQTTRFLTEDAALYVLMLDQIILAAHMLGGLAAQMAGLEVYTGEDFQVRAISQMTEMNKPAATLAA